MAIIDIPLDATALIMPQRFYEVLKSLAHGPFLPFNFPLPIIVSAAIPDDEVWFVKDNPVVDISLRDGMGMIECYIIKRVQISDIKKFIPLLSAGEGEDKPN